LEMFDIRNRRTFLKRCSYPSIALDDLYLGSIITVYSRQLKIVDYGDAFTANKLEVSKGRTLCIIKPDGYRHIGKVVDTIYKNGFVISKLKLCRISGQQAAAFYGDQGLSARAQHLASGPIAVLEVVGTDVQRKWGDIVGIGNGANNPDTLRGVFGTDSVRDAIHGSASDRDAFRELNFFFADSSTKPTAQFNNCTCAIIKPHCVKAGNAGEIIDAILTEGYEISALQMFTLDVFAAEEFLEVYKTVVPDFSAMVEELTDGPCIALEVRGENVVPTFREFCGPFDPEIARHIRPNTLRAKYGANKARNGIHCTDLPEDGTLESEFFFRILQQSGK